MTVGFDKRKIIIMNPTYQELETAINELPLMEPIIPTKTEADEAHNIAEHNFRAKKHAAKKQLIPGDDAAAIKARECGMRFVREARQIAG